MSINRDINGLVEVTRHLKTVADEYVEVEAGGWFEYLESLENDK
jgi:hypothetical protein